MALLVSFAAASSAPYLRWAGAQRGHVVAVFTLDDLDRDHVAVSKWPISSENATL